MSTRFDDRRPTEPEDKAHAEAVRHFAEQLTQFPASRSAIDRLERDIAKIGLAANMAGSKPMPTETVSRVDDSADWHKSVELMENIFLCHRPITGGAEYAVVEHFPARGTNEIWNRGGNAVGVLRMFAQEQRQTTLSLRAIAARVHLGSSNALLHRWMRAPTQTPTDKRRGQPIVWCVFWLTRREGGDINGTCHANDALNIPAPCIM